MTADCAIPDSGEAATRACLLLLRCLLSAKLVSAHIAGMSKGIERPSATCSNCHVLSCRMMAQGANEATISAFNTGTAALLLLLHTLIACMILYRGIRVLCTVH